MSMINTSDIAAKVLIVDDEKGLRRTISHFLTREGHEVDTAEDVHSAISKIQQSRYDVIVSDIIMPGLTGMELLDYVQENSPFTKVILITGEPTVDTASKAVRSGAFDYIAKPVTKDRICQSVQSAFKVKTLEDENRNYREHLEELVNSRTEELKATNSRLEWINQRLRQIVKTTSKLAVCNEISKFGTKLLQEFGSHMQAKGGSIYLTEENGLKLVSSLDPGHAPEFIFFPLENGSVFKRALEEKTPQLIEDIDSLKNINPSNWREYQNGSSLVFPLPNEKEEIIGLITLHNKNSPPFINEDKEIGSILASYSCESLRAIRAYENMRESENRYRLLAENMNDVLWTRDLNLNLNYISPSIERLTGFTPQESMSMSNEEKMPQDSFQMIQQIFIEEIANEQSNKAKKTRSRIIEMEMYHKNGSTIWTEVTVSFLRDEQGQAIGFLGVSRDITERMLIEDQFRQAQKMEAVGRLAGGIAHDFNNILTGIIGNVEMTQMDLKEKDPIYLVLNEINEAARRAADLTNQLLAFSRKQIIKPQIINLNDLIENMRKMLIRIIGEDIDLQTKPDKNIGMIKADPGQVEQIIVNLAVNARDAMEKGGTLTIETAEIKRSEAFPNIPIGDYALLTVSDTGHGMTEEVKKHVFDPFFTTKSIDKGTGLGLATTYGIIKQHNGQIEVQTELDKGTVFKLYFPITKDRKPEPISSRNAVLLPKGNETILLVEDEEMVKNIALRILKRQGYNVLHADSGANAIAVIEQNKEGLSLLLTDIVMPNMNGKELAAKLLDSYPDLKIIYTSGYTDDIIANHGVAENDLNFIAKPYSPQDLAVKVREVLDEN